MKHEVTNKNVGPISVNTTVRIEATTEELAQLRQALATVDRFKQTALRAANAKEGPKGADWTMVGYAVKTDCVIVTVNQGMAG